MITSGVHGQTNTPSLNSLLGYTLGTPRAPTRVTTQPGASNTSVITTNFAPINITNVGVGLLGSGGGGINIQQSVQNTLNQSSQYQNTITNTTNTSNQTTENITNVLNYLFGNQSSIGATVTPYSNKAFIPSVSVSPSETSSQSATPTQTLSATLGNIPWTTLVIVGGVILGVAYFFRGKKK